MPSAHPAPPLVVHVIYALDTGGLENGLVNIINRMPAERYRHAIVCLTTAGGFASRLSRSDIEIIELHKPPGNSLVFFMRLYKVISGLQPAIVHSRNLAALETQVLGLLMPRVRRIHGEHGRDVGDIDGSKKAYRWLRRLLSPLITQFICVSEDLASWLRDEIQIPAKKVTQIYNGVDTDQFREREDKDDALAQSLGTGEDYTVIGTVGRLVEVKDQRTLICAIEHILSIRPELRQRLRVIIVGDGPLRQALEEQAAAVGDLFRFTGDTDRVRDCLAAMDIFVLTSLGEGISNTILEAMSCAKPVVATNVGGNPELVDQGVTGLLFPVGDVRSLASALLDLIENENKKSSLGRAGLQLVKTRHDWSQTVTAYLKVYDSVLGIAEPGGRSASSNQVTE